MAISQNFVGLLRMYELYKKKLENISSKYKIIKFLKLHHKDFHPIVLCYQQNSTHTYKRLFWPQLKSPTTVAEITKCCPKFLIPILILKDIRTSFHMYLNCKSRLCLGYKSQKQYSCSIFWCIKSWFNKRDIYFWTKSYKKGHFALIFLPVGSFGLGQFSTV